MPDLEWRTCESDDEWDATQQKMAMHSVIQPEVAVRNGWLIRHWRLYAVVILTLVISGGWLWYKAQQGVAQIETELQDGVEKDLLSGVAAATNELEAEIRASMATGNVIKGVQIRDLGEDWALVDLQLQLTKDGALYRQTRVYQLRNGRWVRGEGATEEWGAMGQQESRYFVFHYRSIDHQTVSQSAARLDALYVALFTSLFAAEPPDEKLVVGLDPGWMDLSDMGPSSSQAALSVLSPAATLAPEELSPDDLLAQSLMQALFDKLAEDVQEEYELSSQWLPLRNGLRLWFIWSQELPLAIWREPLVKWTLSDSGGAGSAPAFANDLCVNYQLWMRSPLVGGVPVQCMLKATAEEKIVAWRYRYPPRDLALPSLADVQDRSDDANTNLMKEPPEAAASGVAWATVLEYITATYGAEKVPALLAAIPLHESWETLIPAVFDQPLTTFETGWHTFLKERYEIVEP